MSYILIDITKRDYGARLKMDRAKHHLRVLENEISDFLRREPYTLLFEDDLKAGEHVVRVSLTDQTATVGLAAGDFLSCLCSSLDHLVTALTHAKGGVSNDRASFPVIGINNNDGKGQFKRAIRGVPDGAARIIDSLQPYHSGDAYKRTELWRLNRLWNIDKHRRIPFYAHSMNIPVRYPTDMSPVTSRADDGSMVMRFPLEAKGKIHLNPAVQLKFQFGDKEEGVFIYNDEFAEIHEFIGKVVFPKFDSFF